MIEDVINDLVKTLRKRGLYFTLSYKRESNGKRGWIWRWRVSSYWLETKGLHCTTHGSTIDKAVTKYILKDLGRENDLDKLRQVESESRQYVRVAEGLPK